jgi:RNA recognition motif-containing protein
MEKNEKEFLKENEEEEESNEILIKNISLHTTTKNLKLMFQNVGEIIKITSSGRICFIEFSNIEEAKTAKNDYDGYMMDGYRIKIEYVKKEKKSNTINENKYEENETIIIRNLSIETKEYNIRSKFEKFGEISDVRLEQKSLKNIFAFITFKNVESAKKAIEEMNNSLLNHMNILVSFARPLKKVLKYVENPNNTIVIQNLSFETTSEDLISNFKECGKISSARILKNENNESKGMGFIDFENLEGAKNCLEYNLTKFNNRVVQINYAKENPKKRKNIEPEITKKKYLKNEPKNYNNNTESKTIIIKNLNRDYSSKDIEKELSLVFKKCGKILKIDLPKHSNQNIKGFAFIEFDSIDSAKNALPLSKNPFLKKNIFINFKN